MASQITGVSIVCSTVGSGGDQRKYQSSASLAFVDSPHKRPVTRKMFPFDDVIMVVPIFNLPLSSRGVGLGTISHMQLAMKLDFCCSVQLSMRYQNWLYFCFPCMLLCHGELTERIREPNKSHLVIILHMLRHVNCPDMCEIMTCTIIEIKK